MVVIRTLILGIFIFSSAVVFTSCMGTMLINNDPVEANPLLQLLGYIIFDLGAMLIWLFRLLIEAVFWVFTLGAQGDFIGCVEVIAQCAISLLYHLIAFGLTLLFMPAGILNSLTVMFFQEVGLGTSVDDDGNAYVAFADVPVFGELTYAIDVSINFMHNNLVVKGLGDPDEHKGGIYDVIEFDLCVPNCVDNPFGGEICAKDFNGDRINICISIGMILDAMPYDLGWKIIDYPISVLFNATKLLCERWDAFREAELFPFDFLDDFLLKAVDFIMENMLGWMLLEDTYELYWDGLGLTTPHTWIDQSYSTPGIVGGGLGEIVDHLD